MTDPRTPDEQALAEYLARMRTRLPGTADAVGAVAQRALTVQQARVSPEQFSQEFGGIIRALQALGVTMDNASKQLAETEIEGSDGNGVVRVVSTATMKNVRVHLGPDAQSLPPRHLEQAIAEAFASALLACSDLTVRTVDQASSRARHHMPGPSMPTEPRP